MDYPHFSVNFVNFGIHKLSTLIKMWPRSCVKAGGAAAARLTRRTALPSRPAGGTCCGNPSCLLPAPTSQPPPLRTHTRKIEYSN